MTNIKDHGAAGDGQALDSPAIQRASHNLADYPAETTGEGLDTVSLQPNSPAAIPAMAVS